MADAGDLRARALLDNTDFLGKMGEMAKATADSTQNIAKQVEGVTKAFEAMGTLMGAFKVGKGISDFVNDAMDAANAENRMKSGFEALNGVSDDTNKIFSDMKNLGLHSMFDFQDVLAPSVKQLMLMGVSGDQAAATMHALVDAATALKQGPEWIEGVNGALSNMSSHITATAKDMKALQQQGVDAWSSLATQLGVSVTEAQAMVKKGAVDSQTVIKAVTEGLKDDYAGSAEAASGSWKQAVKTMGTLMDEAKESFGQSLLAVMKQFTPVIQEISTGIEALTDWWKELSEPVKDTVLAIGGAVAVVTALAVGIPVATTALATLGTALSGMGVALGASTLGIAAVVAALALIGEWVYKNWPAVKAVFLVLWDEITAKWQALWNGVVSFFTAIWDSIKGVVQPVVTWISGVVSDVIGVIGKVIGAVGTVAGALLGQSDTWNKVTQAWKQGQDQITATAAAQKAHTDAVNAHRNATLAVIQTTRAQTAADLVQANQNEANAKAAKAAAEEQKKQAAEAKEYNDSLAKTYEALRVVAPDVAAKFDALYGGMKSGGVDAATVVGKAWTSLDAGTQQLIQSTLELGKALVTLGVTTETQLKAKLTDAGAAYQMLADSGTATSADLYSAMESLVKKQQTLIDDQTADQKKAYDDRKITADNYYDHVIADAQTALDATQKAYNDGTATAAEVTAAQITLSNDKKAKLVQDTKDFQDAIHALGEKSGKDLDDAIQKWAEYAEAIHQKLGVDTPQYIEATIGEMEALKAKANDLGNLEAVAYYDSQIDKLRDDLEAARTPQQNFNAAIAAMKTPDYKTLQEGLLDYAEALNTAKRNADGTATSQLTVIAAQEQLNKKVDEYINSVNGPLKAALDAGKITGQQYADSVAAGAKAVADQFTAIGVNAGTAGTKADAAAAVTNAALKTVANDGVKALNDAYSTLGIRSQKFYTDEATKAHDAYVIIADDRNATWVQKDQAWLSQEIAADNAIVAAGGSIPEGQKNDIAKMQQQLTDHFNWQTSQWQTTFDGVKSAVGGAFDSIIDKVVTGKGSFKEILTTMWQDVAKAALEGFLTPVKTAIENFVSNTLANLLTGKGGLSDLSTSLTDIGSKMTSIFKSGSSVAGDITGGLSGAAGDPSLIGTLSNPLAGLGGALPGAASGAAGAASGAASAVSGVMGMVNMVSGIVGAAGAVVGAIGTFVEGTQENKALNSIDSNTLKAALFLGAQGDGGIHAKIAQIRDALFGGPIWWELDMIRDNLNDRIPEITDNSRDSLSCLMDIKGILTDLNKNVISGFASLSISVTASGVTTAEAARALGNQIAQNLAGQLTPTHP